MNRQAIVLHKYYELLVDAIQSYRNDGYHYLVNQLALEAGKSLGDDAVAVSTVRYWHVNYLEGGGVFKPDERGHYTRELLINEEDVKAKFVKWSLKAAKDSDLSVESARDYLNDKLLSTLEVKACWWIVEGRACRHLSL